MVYERAAETYPVVGFRDEFQVGFGTKVAYVRKILCIGLPCKFILFFIRIKQGSEMIVGKVKGGVSEYNINMNLCHFLKDYSSNPTPLNLSLSLSNIS